MWRLHELKQLGGHCCRTVLRHRSTIVNGASLSTSLPVVYHKAYSRPQLPPGHRFPMKVFEEIYTRLLHQGLIHPHQVHQPPQTQPLVSETALHMVHDKDYLRAFTTMTLNDDQIRRIGFGAACMRNPDVVERTLAEVAGTLLTARLALQHGLAVNTAGGTHHAYPAAGSGFCILNDLAVTAKVLLSEGAVGRVAVLDLDVHQGDGTAVCLQDEPRATTLSVHCQSNFPTRKAVSTLDVGLPDKVDDRGYMRMLSELIPGVLQDWKPDLVLYDAGVDVHERDSLGRLSLSDQGLARREAMVLDTCLSAGIPVAGVVGGGYDPDLGVLAERHMHLHRCALAMWQDHKL
ncbi:histone deacetylase [Dunaliella salina]|uniref:Histone deacetylase n=1 Tax=Dunaliella salina TaxID=3046 RepID=A0ABQ7GYC4_DUNSA|nr:histone deacetylase [Dunaliella salina]|eukprot:KAF5839593.1 histone deacetylase [Dunaliella salina]